MSLKTLILQHTTKVVTGVLRSGGFFLPFFNIGSYFCIKRPGRSRLMCYMKNLFCYIFGFAKKMLNTRVGAQLKKKAHSSYLQQCGFAKPPGL